MLCIKLYGYIKPNWSDTKRSIFLSLSIAFTSVVDLQIEKILTKNEICLGFERFFFKNMLKGIKI